MIHKLTCALIVATLATLSANADTITTKDGSTLHGTITLIDKGEIHIDTNYAGKIKLKQDEVATFQTETPVVVRLESGTKMAGTVSTSSNGKLKIQSEDGVLETNTSKIAASWAPGGVDPEIDRNSRKWKYDLALNLSGKKGNTDKFHLGTDLDVRLKGPDDELSFGFEYEQGDENDNKTDDRALGRIGYERFNPNNDGWYVHNALETDKISDIYMRSTTGGGASYRVINNDKQTLIVRSGLGYRFTDFETEGKDNDSSATFETSLEHSYQYKEFCFIENTLYYSPALDDFGNYRAIHDSSLKIPVGNGENFWIRMGIKNEYESQTSAEKKLDTSYYTKLIWSWK
jgi:putative salt-induced outer membrane protein YdiY